jgi:soluble lytic murein transglycosylase
LGRLLRRYRDADDPLPFALADYNAGRTHVLRWSAGAGATNAAVFCQQITFPGTRRYVEAVVHRRQRYAAWAERVSGDPPAVRPGERRAGGP